MRVLVAPRWCHCSDRSDCSACLIRFEMIRLLLFSAIVVFLGACSPEIDELPALEPHTSTRPESEIRVVDYLGRDVILERSASRIVALSPHIVENLYSAGAGERIVAAVAYSDYPEPAKSIDQLGGVGSVSLEAIIAMSPDLVVVWGSGDQNSSQLVRRLEKLAIPVYVDEPRVLSDVARSIADLGKLAGSEREAQAASKAYLAALDGVRLKYKNLSPIKVFYQIWDDPLQTLNGEHMVSSMMTLCGAANVFADAPLLAPQVSVEAVIERNPDIIFASANEELGEPWLNEWRSWDSLKAVKHNALFRLNPDWMSRPTVRLLHGLREMCLNISSVRES